MLNNKKTILITVFFVIMVLFIVIGCSMFKRNSFENISCADTDTISILKGIRNKALFEILDSSQYYFNGDYQIEYKNVITNSVDKNAHKCYCKAQEVIKNLFFADENVYIKCDFEYTTQLTSDNKHWVETTVIEDLLDNQRGNTCHAYDISGSELDFDKVHKLLEVVDSNNE